MKLLSHKQNIKIQAHHALLALIIYTVFSLLFFGNGILPHPICRLVGSGSNDVYFYLYLLDWWPHALLHQLNSFLLTHLWHPVGLNIEKFGGMSPWFFVSPISYLFGPELTYNLLILLGPVLMAFSAFLLCLELTDSPTASIIGGYIYGFSPYSIIQILGSHLPLVLAPTLCPIIVLIGIKYLKKEISALNFIFLIVLFQAWLFISLLEITITFNFLLILAMIYWYCFIPQLRKDLRNLIYNYLIAGAFTLLITSRLIYAFFFGLPKVNFAISPAGYSNDLFSFFIPTHLFQITNHLIQGIASQIALDPAEACGYIGLPVIILALYIFIKHIKNPHIKPLFLLLVSTMILSLGPQLHILGKLYFTSPWFTALQHLPGLKNLLPSRFSMYTSLVLSIIITFWLSSPSHRYFLKLFIAILAIAFLLPTFNQSIRKTSFPKSQPDFFRNKTYTHYIKKNENVLVLPFSNPGPYWLVMSKNNFNLATSSMNMTPDSLEPEYLDAVVYNRIVSTKINKLSEDFLKYKVHVIIFYRQSMAQEIIQIWLPLLKKLNCSLVYKHEIDVYRCSPLAQN